MELRTANNKPLNVVGIIDKIEVCIDNKKYVADFIVSSDMLKPCILGYNFLKDNKMTLCFGGKSRLENNHQLESHRIETGPTLPIAVKSYRVGPELEKVISDKGVIKSI